MILLILQYWDNETNRRMYFQKIYSLLKIDYSSYPRIRKYKWDIYSYITWMYSINKYIIQYILLWNLIIIYNSVYGLIVNICKWSATAKSLKATNFLNAFYITSI